MKAAEDSTSMVTSSVFPLDGGCDCGLIRYRMLTRPLFVHCCHCRWCQRETGASFALNAMIESDRVVHLGSEPEIIDTPSNSGKGQKVARCPSCRIAVWSNYAGAGPVIRFVRVGTLDGPDHLSPDIHIFTASKQTWFQLPAPLRQCPNTTIVKRFGRWKVLPAIGLYCRRLRLIERAGPSVRAPPQRIARTRSR